MALASSVRMFSMSCWNYGDMNYGDSLLNPLFSIPAQSVGSAKFGAISP